MISIKVNTVERSGDIIAESFRADLVLTNEADTCEFQVRKYGDRVWTPAFDDDVVVQDGSTKIFGGKVASVDQVAESGVGGALYTVHCVDHSFEADRVLLSGIFENMTIEDILASLVAQLNTKLGSSFTANNVVADIEVARIVFNQVPITFCLRKLADIVRYDWYWDPDKDLHFFERETNAAPFALSDTAGNHKYKSLVLTQDGSQLINRVKVLGGVYNGEEFSDIITVVGDDTKTFVLPYQFANLQIELDTGSGFEQQSVGAKFLESFPNFDVLYDFNSQSIEFESNLADGDRIRFTGNPKVPVRAIAEDAASVALYGQIEKLIRDESIVDNNVARRRAAAELLAFASEVVNAKFSTLTAGLLPGQIITIESAIRGIASQDLLIKRVSFSFLDPDSFQYDVELISTQQYTLIDLLRKITDPVARPDDDRESAEELFSAEDGVDIGDEAALDPIDPGNFNPVWGNYTLTSDADVNRPFVWGGGATWG